MTTLQEAIKAFPQMEVWNDSCSCKELTYALEQCAASGATTNPAIVFNVLKKELPDWEDTIKKNYRRQSDLHRRRRCLESYRGSRLEGCKIA